MKKFFMFLAFALLIWSVLALVGIISWQAVLGCGILYGLLLFLHTKGEGGFHSFLCITFAAVIATFLWECGNDNIRELSFFGKLINNSVVSCLLAISSFMAIYAVKFMKDAIADYYRDKAD